MRIYHVRSFQKQILIISRFMVYSKRTWQSTTIANDPAFKYVRTERSLYAVQYKFIIIIRREKSERDVFRDRRLCRRKELNNLWPRNPDSCAEPSRQVFNSIPVCFTSTLYFRGLCLIHLPKGLLHKQEPIRNSE